MKTSIVVYKNLEDIVRMRPEWDRLHSFFKKENPFLSSGWVYNWYKFVGNRRGKIFCLAFYEDKRITAIAPLFIKLRNTPFFKKSIEFACQEASSYLDILCADYNRDIIWQKLLDFLIKNKRLYNRIFFDGVKLPEAVLVSTRYFKYRRAPEKDCWRLTLGTNLDKYINKLDRKFSKSLLHCMRRVKKIGFDFEIIEKQNFEEAWAEFVQLHLAYIKRKGEETLFSWDAFRYFAKEASRSFLQSNSLKLCRLRLQNRTAAILWVVETKRGFFYLNIGLNSDFHKVSLGITLPILCIEHAIKNNKDYFDFLSGRDEYKQKMGAKEIAQYRLLGYSGRMAAIQDVFISLIKRARIR